jgi:hypothetical protein
MRQDILLTHEFVEFIPDELRQDTVYISLRFATASHLCCCGCGNKVVTPLRPTDWRLIFDGKAVSLDPSIGNWSFPCRSHYWISHSRVRWAPQWSKDRIEAGRAQDQFAKDKYFGHATEAAARLIPEPVSVKKAGLWDKVRNWWFRQ